MWTYVEWCSADRTRVRTGHQERSPHTWIRLRSANMNQSDSRRKFLATGVGAAAWALTPAFAESQDLAALTLKRASELLRSKGASPVELTQASLKRIEKYNPAVNAFITITAESALATARAMEAEAFRKASTCWSRKCDRSALTSICTITSSSGRVRRRRKPPNNKRLGRVFWSGRPRGVTNYSECSRR